MSQRFAFEALSRIALACTWLPLVSGAQAEPPSDVVVRGPRASAASALALKREAPGVLDAVVAEDIGRLPDLNVTEALQRVAGVQIARDRGEGAGVAVRGLVQVETLLDGREVFTAGTGRSLDFTDLPAELVSAIEVHKTASAAQIEGGLGGSIDLHSWRPLDFGGHAGVLALRAIHGDLARATRPQFALLASTRGHSAEAGGFGLLVNLSLQRRAFREDLRSTGAPLLRTDLLPGQAVSAPNGTSDTMSVGERRRSAAAAVLQWRPRPALELLAEFNATELRTRQDSHQVNVAAGPTAVPGSVALFPGTADVMQVTWERAPVSLLSFARDTVDRNRMAALAAQWEAGGGLLLKADLSHTRSVNRLFFSGPFAAATAATFRQDLAPAVPVARVEGTDLTDPANWRITGIAYRDRPFEGRLSAARMDASQTFDAGPWTTLDFGLRHARRHADNAPGLVFADATVSGLSAADRPDLVQADRYGFMPGTGPVAPHLIGNLALARDPLALRAAAGVGSAIPDAGNPLGVWRIEETTDAAYAAAAWRAAAGALQGQLGARVVRTHETVTGNESVPSAGGVVPVAVDHVDRDWLPSATLRWAWAEGWLLRAAASKTVTRVGFDQLSPSLTLVPNSIDHARNSGFAGNPELKPMRAQNLDLGVEHHRSDTDALTAILFWKQVDGFVTSVAAPEEHDGATYLVSRPQNVQRARLKGVELGWQQFVGRWGLLANYTWVDSRMPLGPLGDAQPLANLSRNSANVVGVYEAGRVSARLAWNWRDRFLTGFTSVVGVGALPLWTEGYAWADAGLRLRAGEGLTWGLDVTNLLRTVRRSYHGEPTRPQGAWLNDRQWVLTLNARFS